jgi:hypothetical protein
MGFQWRNGRVIAFPATHCHGVIDLNELVRTSAGTLLFVFIIVTEAALCVTRLGLGLCSTGRDTRTNCDIHFLESVTTSSSNRDAIISQAPTVFGELIN